MKKRLIIIGPVVIMFSLTACSTKEKTTTIKEPTGNVEDTKDKVAEEKSVEPVKKEVKVKEEKPSEPVKMSYEEMVKSSDYIAKVKMIQKGKNKFELKVLENIIGNINASDVPNTDLLKPNRTYVILLRDVDGKKQPTNGKESYVLLEGNNKKIFDAVYEMFRSK